MTPTGRMADSVTPWLIPEIFRVGPNGVAAYYNGRYAWPNATVVSYPHHWRISVDGSVASAPHARVIDVERYDATPQDVAPFQEARADQEHDTVAYCNRSTVPAIIAHTPGHESLIWWIATLDGVAWNPVVLSNHIRAEYGVPVNPDRIRAIQCFGRGHYDESLMYGNSEW